MLRARGAPGPAATRGQEPCPALCVQRGPGRSGPRVGRPAQIRQIRHPRRFSYEPRAQPEAPRGLLIVCSRRGLTRPGARPDQTRPDRGFGCWSSRPVGRPGGRKDALLFRARRTQMSPPAPAPRSTARGAARRLHGRGLRSPKRRRPVCITVPSRRRIHTLMPRALPRLCFLGRGLGSLLEILCLVNR